MRESYTSFAKKYDEMMFDTDYSAWSDFVVERLRDRGVEPPAHILETACGTGNVSFYLHKAGFTLTATDSQEEMLNIAVDKCRKKGQKIQFVLANMVDLQFENRFDCVVCCCDGVNYLDSRSVRSFLKGAYGCLKERGILTFDISTSEKLRDTLGNNIFCDETEDCAYIWRNELQGDRVCMELSMFINEEGDLFKRCDEYHELFIHTNEFIINELNGAGFCHISMETGQPITSGRVQFTARKG